MFWNSDFINNYKFNNAQSTSINSNSNCNISDSNNVGNNPSNTTNMNNSLLVNTQLVWPNKGVVPHCLYDL